jgi:hypothetical protein
LSITRKVTKQTHSHSIGKGITSDCKRVNGIGVAKTVGIQVITAQGLNNILDCSLIASLTGTVGQTIDSYSGLNRGQTLLGAITVDINTTGRFGITTRIVGYENIQLILGGVGHHHGKVGIGNFKENRNIQFERGTQRRNGNG